MTPESVVRLLAAMMVAEVGVLGPAAMVAVCSVAENRVADPRFPSTMEGVIMGGFYGRGEVTDVALGLAEVCLAIPDTTGGMLYAISEEDRVSLGCGEGALIWERGPWKTHMSREWCQ